MKRLALVLLITAATAVPEARQAVSFASLANGQSLREFRTLAVYLDAVDRPIGARFVHQQTGFTLDLLEIQSVPQAFVWVTTYPTSDMGEPHTQEHLLLGKGNAGRAVASRESIDLAVSTAFTSQWRTCYSFYTSAGADVFYDELERRMDALLHPDYTDEEVHREVRNFGITETPTEHTLGLEEKGSVYNEMVSSMDQPGNRIYRAAMKMVYGDGHPLQFNSGGTPEALRVIQASDIRTFHASHYFLANMGAVVSVPKEMPIDGVLTQLDARLRRVQPRRPTTPVTTEKQLPPPAPVPAGEIRLVEYPHQSDQQPGSLWFVWPADRTLDPAEETLLSVFLDAFAGDSTTNLYKRFIDSKTREVALGAQRVFGETMAQQGFPVIVGFGDVPVAKMNERDIADLRTRVRDELDRVAAWNGDAPELKELNERVRSRVIALRRDLAKFVNSPPAFGFRGTGAEWIDHLTLLNRDPGFRKSLTMTAVLSGIDAIVAKTGNPWATYLPRWHLLNVVPWALAAKPNPALVTQQQREREARSGAEIARLKAVYGATDDQAALRRYRSEYDAASAEIDRAASRVTPPKFVDRPPMTLDDQLEFKVAALENGVPLVTSTFDSMTSATTGIALRLDVVPQDQLRYVSMLPQLLTEVGVIERGNPVSYPEMSERLRKEILSLAAEFSTNAATGRVELTVRGAGNDATESQKAIDWMRLVLAHPDWRPANLPRIRDLVDQVLNALRRTMQTAEENWVRQVATAYWRQDSPPLLATTSFMTRVHNIYRLRWMLKAGSAEERAVAAKRLTDLSGMPGSRADLKAYLSALQTGQGTLVADAAKDLDLTLSEIPDSSLSADWSRLCREMAADLTMGPDAALASLEAVRRQILKTGNARVFQIASTSSQQILAPSVRALAGDLAPAPAVKAAYDGVKLVTTRLRERMPDAGSAPFVGLLNPNSQSGVFVNSAPLTAYADTDPDKLLDYLSTNLYGGGGGHSIFMKTWGAGLAYSNGLGDNLATGRLGYYAERTPELPQTLRFVVGELQNATPDAGLVEYAIAQAFTGTRSASSYESRGEQMAQNLVDDITPEVVTRFHQRILDLRRSNTLVDELYERKDRVSSRVLPGMGASWSPSADGVYFVIGPEKQFVAWEEYLKSAIGAGTKVFRLYPRDFWN